jgi:hypothetical protein
MFLPEDDFHGPERDDARIAYPQYSDETEEEYEKRLGELREIDLVDFRYLDSQRKARMPFYPLVKHLEAHISHELKATRDAVREAMGLVCFMLLVVLMVLLFRR